jgi:hypothetical protein
MFSDEAIRSPIRKNTEELVYMNDDQLVNQQKVQMALDKLSKFSLIEGRPVGL